MFGDAAKGKDKKVNILLTTGCSKMINQKFQLRTWARMQHRSWERRIFLMTFGHFKIVSLKALKTFMYFQIVGKL